MAVVQVPDLCSVPTFVDEATGQTFKLGRAAVRLKPGAPRLRSFLKMAAAPAPPSHDLSPKAVESLKRMYMNDRYGCCVITGKAHADGVWSANDNAPIILASDAEITNAYFGICGPGDNGCYIPAVLDVMKSKGIMFGGKLRKIAGWVAGDPSDIEECKVGCILFGGFCIGFNVPAEWMQIGDGGTWDTPISGRFVGGHDVQIVGYDTIGVKLSTWGGLRTMTWRAFTNPRIVDELYYMLSPDWTNDDRLAPNGIDVEGLVNRLSIIGTGEVPDWEPVVPPPEPPIPPVPPIPPQPTITLTGSAVRAAYTFEIQTGILGRTQTVTIPGQTIPITVSGPLPKPQGEPMFLLSLIKKLRTEAGLSHAEWGTLVREVNDCKDDAALESLHAGKYGKLTPEQWQAIITLILTLLPLFIN